MTARSTGTVRYTVTTQSLADRAYTATITGLPTGVTTPDQITIANNTATLTLSGSTTTVAGAATLTLTIEGAVSPAFTLTISAAAVVTPSDNYGGDSGGGGGAPVVNTQVIAETETPLADIISIAPFINGYPDGAFRGADPITREEFINILFKIKNPVALPAADVNNPDFNDVAADRWSYDAIEWAAGAGIIEADANGNFRPGDSLKRSEMAVILTALEGWTETAENTFSDISDNPDRDAILMAVNKGIFEGYPDGTFAPDGTATRYELVTAMVRYLLGSEPADDMWTGIVVTFTDVPLDHWAYKYMALATKGYVQLPG